MHVAEITPSSQVGTGSAITITWLTTVGAHVMGWLPSIITMIGGVMAIGWYGLQYYESKTFQSWYAKHATVRKMRKIAKLEARQKVLSAQLEALQIRTEADGDCIGACAVGQDGSRSPCR
jgi:ABC-type phosphate transport system auxiliary subunit